MRNRYVNIKPTRPSSAVVNIIIVIHNVIQSGHKYIHLSSMITSIMKITSRLIKH